MLLREKQQTSICSVGLVAWATRRQGEEQSQAPEQGGGVGLADSRPSPHAPHALRHRLRQPSTACRQPAVARQGRRRPAASPEQARQGRRGRGRRRTRVCDAARDRLLAFSPQASRRGDGRPSRARAREACLSRCWGAGGEGGQERQGRRDRPEDTRPGVSRPPRPWRPMGLRAAEDVEVPRPPRAAPSPAPSPAKSRLPPQYANRPLKPRVPGPAARACPGQAGFGGAWRRRLLSSRPSRHQAPPGFHSLSRRIFAVAAAAWLATRGRPAYRDARLAAAAGIPGGSESAVPRRQSDRRKKERDDAIAELNALRAARPPLAGARTRQSRAVPAPATCHVPAR